MSNNFMINQTNIKLIRDDLTALDVEAFVFYAQPDLALGSGYGNAISMRGGPTIKAELEKIGNIEAFAAVATDAGELKANKIIHAAGPSFKEEGIQNKLKTTINNALKCADENGLTQLAFPLMGIGFYGVLPDESISIMKESFSNYLNGTTGLREIIVCANDNREYRVLTAKFDK